MRLGVVVRPDDDASTVAVASGIGAQGRFWSQERLLGIQDVGIPALEITADPDAATGVVARRVDGGLVRHGHAAAQHIHLAAACARGVDAARSVDVGVSGSPEHHRAPLQRGRRGPDVTAVAKGAGKYADRVALQPPQVARLVGGRLHQHRDAFQAAAGDLDLLASCQDRAAIGCLQQCAATHIDVRCHQHDVTIARRDAPADREAGGATHRSARFAETQPPGQRVGVAHAQRRCGEAGGVDDSARTDGDTGLVHQDQAAVGRQVAEDRGRCVGDDPVDGQAGSGWLHDGGRSAGRDREALPVDGRVAGARTVLGDYPQLVGRRLGNERLAMDGHAAAGQCLCLRSR